MYRIKEIQNKLMHVVGWEQAFDPAKSIDRDLTRTESGLTFQGAHPLLTLDNVRSIMPDDWGFQYPDWNIIREFKTGDRVKHNNIIWIAQQDNQNEEPTASDFNNDFSRDDYGNPFWKPYNELSDYLRKLTKDGIAKMVQTFIQIKGLNEETKNLLEQTTFFDGAGRIAATVQNRGKLVGFEINPVRSLGVTAQINRIGLQFTGGTGVVKMYLFHSSKIDPVKTFELNYTVTNGGFQWFNIEEAFLPYIGTETNAGGSWFLCYNQNDLPDGMEAINVSKDWSREPCGTCNVGNIENWKALTKYVQVSPFTTTALGTFEQFPELWDINENIYTNTQNYGLNVELSVGCDLTDFIISQRQMFQTVLQRQIAVIALRTMAMNPDVRVNRNQSNVSKMDLLYEIDGNTNGVRPNGLGYDLKKAYEAISLDTKGIDRFCLGCNNRGVKYRTV